MCDGHIVTSRHPIRVSVFALATLTAASISSLMPNHSHPHRGVSLAGAAVLVAHVLARIRTRLPLPRDRIRRSLRWFEKASNFHDRFSGESAVKPVKITGGMMTAKARVQKHRAKLKADQCGRLEAWVSTDLIEALRTIARQQNRYLWAVVKDPLKAPVTRHAALVTAPHRK